MGQQMTRENLRPFERTVLRLADNGMSSAEIGWRFRRSPGHIDRVLELSRMPRDHTAPPATAGALRPLERCVLRARENGVDPAETAARLRRTPGYVRRVEQYASYKLAQGAGA